MNKNIKTVGVFTLLKVGEVGLLIGLLFLFYFVGGLLMGGDWYCEGVIDVCEKTAGNYFIQTIVGFMVTFIGAIVIFIVGGLMLYPLIKKNWEWAKKIVNNGDKK